MDPVAVEDLAVINGGGHDVDDVAAKQPNRNEVSNGRWTMNTKQN